MHVVSFNNFSHVSIRTGNRNITSDRNKIVQGCHLGRVFFWKRCSSPSDKKHPYAHTLCQETLYSTQLIFFTIIDFTCSNIYPSVPGKQELSSLILFFYRCKYSVLLIAMTNYMVEITGFALWLCYAKGFDWINRAGS